MKLSIIVPVYNTAEYLPKCLDSVICPGVDGYEIIIVNDGSTDSSKTVAESYVNRYPELIRLITTENGGLGQARNVGIENAHGEYLLFLDSDDSLSDNAVPEIMETLRQDYDIFIYDFVFVNPDGAVLSTEPGCRRSGEVSLESYPELLMEYPSGCNKICRRRLFTDSGLRFPGRVWYEDLRTMPKLYTMTDKIYATGKPWYVYLQRPGSITNAAKLDRNVEIIDAVDDLTEFYKAHGLYERYKNELEYIRFYNEFLTASARICPADSRHPLLKTLREDFLAKCPGYKDNPYIRAIPPKHKLLCSLFMRGRYGEAGALLRLNNARKGAQK